MNRNILVIDDEAGILNSLSGALIDEGYLVKTASNGAAGLEILKNERPDVVILDIWMPQMDGLEVLKQIKNDWPDQTVIMMSGHGNIETAVKATKLGAYDFVEKPLSLEKILVLLQNIVNVQDLTKENQALKKQLQKQKTVVGESPAIKQIQELVKKVAPTTGSVLLTGENGTGKEVIAHLIHGLSPRFNKAFIEVNCAAIPEELIESELFGHVKGAFSGAIDHRRGKFDLANGGTLFLDEIGDMSLKTQAKILRVLQDQRFERVGGAQTIQVDVRIIAATNKDLKSEITANRFREDLYHRLKVVPFHIPPLRDRKVDIRLLAHHFLKEFSQSHQKKLRALSHEAQNVLEGYHWPGNVRELKNLMERVVILSADENSPISAAELLSHLQDDTVLSSEIQKNFTGNLRDARQEFEKDFIVKTLNENEWNVSKTAAVLGIERSHLHRKMKDLKIDASE